MKVLVVGGAGYIGSHAVRELVKEGNDVVVLDALYTGHRKAVDPKAKFYQGDIEDTFLVSKILRDEKIDAVMHFAAYSLVPESVKKPLKYYDNNVAGMISLLQAMNDAGVAVPGPIWELPTRDWEWILHADLMSQVYALRKVIPIMMKQENGGDILNVASAAGLLTAPGMPAYYATKFAVVGMSEAVAYDLQAYKQDKIHIHVFTPAFVQTHLMHSEEYRPANLVA